MNPPLPGNGHSHKRSSSPLSALMKPDMCVCPARQKACTSGIKEEKKENWLKCMSFTPAQLSRTVLPKSIVISDL